jgi:uncharacterized protein DUF5677
MASKVTTKRVTANIRRLEKWLNGLDAIPATNLYRGKVLFGLLSKALTVSRAICVLLDAGFPAEAFALSRTLIEIYFSVRYIGNKDTEKRAEKYVEYWKNHNEVLQDLVRSYFPRNALNLPPAKPATKTQKHAWTGYRGQIKMMADEGSPFEMDALGQPLTAKFDYDSMYFMTSHFVHVTIIALVGHAPRVGQVFHVRANKPAERKYGKLALSNILSYVLKISISACRSMNEDQPQALQEMFDLLKVAAGS